MPKKRRFFVVSIPKMIDSDQSMTEDFNVRVNRVIPADVDVHLIGMAAIDGRVVCIFREYDERPRK